MIITPDDHARLAEYHIVLAWLGDPVTCPCQLRAQVTDKCLEVSGTVPTREVKTRAMQLASAHVSKPVLDSITVRPAPNQRPRVESVERLRSLCQEALDEGPGKVVFDLHMDADADGLVSIRGTIPSLEEKLAVSQRLRRVRGCNAIRNDLTVWNITDVGRAYMLVTASGSHLVLAEEAQTQAPAKLPDIVPAAAISPQPAATAPKAGRLTSLFQKLVPSQASASKIAPPPLPTPAIQQTSMPLDRPQPPASLPPLEKPTASRPATIVPAIPSPIAPEPKRAAQGQPTAVPIQPAPVAAVPATAVPPTAVPLSSHVTLRSETTPPQRKDVTPPIRKAPTAGTNAQIVTIPGAAAKTAQAQPARPDAASKPISAPGIAPAPTSAPPASAASTPPKPVLAELASRSAATPATVAKDTGKAPTSFGMLHIWKDRKQMQAPVTVKAPQRYQPAPLATAAPQSKGTASPAAVVTPPSAASTTATAATSSSTEGSPPLSAVAPAAPTSVPSTPSTATVGSQPPTVATPPSVARDVSPSAMTSPPVTAPAPVAETPPPAPAVAMKTEATESSHPAMVADASPPNVKLQAPVAMPQPVLPVGQRTVVQASYADKAADAPGTALNPVPAAYASASSEVRTALYREKPARPETGPVTSGVVVLASASDEPVSAAGATMHLQAWLQHLVVTTCGNDASDINLVLRSTTEIDVQLRTHEPALAQSLAERILRLPELSPYRVMLEIQVKK